MLNPEQSLTEKSLHANFTEVQQDHFDKLMSELEVISDGLGFAELKVKAEAGDKEALQVMRDYIAKKEQIVEFIENKEISEHYEGLVNPKIIKDFVENCPWQVIELDRWERYSESDGKLNGRICIKYPLDKEGHWYPIINGDIVRKLTDPEGKEIPLSGCRALSFKDDQVLGFFRSVNGRGMVATIDEAGNIEDSIENSSGYSFESNADNYANVLDLHFDEKTGESAFILAIEDTQQEKRLAIYDGLSEFESMNWDSLQMINHVPNGISINAADKRGVPIINGIELFAFENRSIIDCKNVKNIDNQLCGVLFLQDVTGRKEWVVVHKGKRAEIQNTAKLVDEFKYEFVNMKYGDETISGICQTKRKLGGKVFQSLPIVNGSVLDNIGGHEIGQVRSLQVAGDQINGCMEFFDYGGYRPVVNGVVINKIENHEIVD